MKVLLRKNVYNLGQIGDVVDVKPGYARNYLLPQGLAYQPSEANIRRVEGEKAAYLEELARVKAEIEARAKLIEGKEVTIAARANEEGHLYGSVGPAQIVAALAEQNVFVEPRNIQLDDPIRQLDKYDVTIRFDQEVTAAISVWVVPVREIDSESDAEQVDAATPEAQAEIAGTDLPPANIDEVDPAPVDAEQAEPTPAETSETPETRQE
jgi:large subunit ribosomal protein L9